MDNEVAPFQHNGQMVGCLQVLLDHGHVVAALQQHVGQVLTDLAAAGDNDVHGILLVLDVARERTDKLVAHAGEHGIALVEDRVARGNG